MTEAEAKKIIERDLPIMLGTDERICAIKVLLSCLQDLEYLRRKHDITMQLLEKYREIGTVDELITLKRKSIAVRPIRNPNRNWDYEEVTCPNCGITLDVKSNYCSCGQRIIMEE